jgi:HlyD family secretion protein
MTRLRWLALLLVPLSVAAGSVLWSRRPIEVPVAVPEREVPLRVFGLGTVEARVLSRVGFDVPGVLVAMMADHGDRVAAGTVLARLDPAAQGARFDRMVSLHDGRIEADERACTLS